MIVLKSLLLAAHLLVMNIAAAGPLAAVVIQFCGTGQHDDLRRLGRKIAASSLACLFIGLVIGLLSGVVMWQTGEDRFFQALARFPSKIFFGVWELAFYVLCMGIYIAWWFRPPKSLVPNLLFALVGLAAASNMLLQFHALMTAIAHIAATEPIGEDIGPGAFRELIFTPHLMSRWLHIWMASFATTGLFVSWYALRVASNELGEQEDDNTAGDPLQSAVACGGRVALAATLLQIPLGMWLLLNSPQAEQSRLMGGDWLATGLFLASLIAAIALMHQLAAIALGSGDSRNIKIASVTLVLTILFMSATLLLARGDAFRPTNRGDDLPQANQVGATPSGQRT